MHGTNKGALDWVSYLFPKWDGAIIYGHERMANYNEMSDPLKWDRERQRVHYNETMDPFERRIGRQATRKNVTGHNHKM